ncbi:MerR family transcriptional regulator [Salisediminibacterium selenitireducens]|uniref:Transcriptional regulator, MerR family n=1 Tax=Bacillus selenitireducens (strain ATCC 700615 / DSM 15326 / MLS10) TaxID=439292 RepID=D6XYD1_BACIE|nr:MerR family transcriptional regulator [Salisediminibacterium selenitireducens]ADI00200.1 transcriptional regulator, MerR family [[Bacillus] selenitireducens MLS10]
MTYTVKALAELAGVSTRTLRYYDQIGLLKPALRNPSGYRIYRDTEVDRLQDILFLKALDVGLDEIQVLLSAPDDDRRKRLEQHREALVKQRSDLDRLIANVDQTIDTMKGMRTMTNEEKFEGLKTNMIRRNEETYGKEIREKYGDQTVDDANETFQGLSKDAYEEAQALSEEILRQLEAAFLTGGPAGKEAMELAAMHKRWLMHYWTSYDPNAHAGLAQMYTADERFTAYYEKKEGMTAFLRDAIVHYTDQGYV